MDKRTNEQSTQLHERKEKLNKNDMGQKEELDWRWSDEIGARRENGRKETKGKAKNGHDR